MKSPASFRLSLTLSFVVVAALHILNGRGKSLKAEQQRCPAFLWCARHGVRRESAVRLDVVSNW
jgi:hypothetical protein